MRKIYELKNTRSGLMNAAEAALEAKDMALYNAKMGEVDGLNIEITALEKLEAEQNRFGAVAVPTPPVEGDVGNSAFVDVLASTEYKEAFVYALRNGIGANQEQISKAPEVLRNALTESGGTPKGSDGGFLVPEDFGNQIIEFQRQNLDLSQYFTVEPVTTLSGTRPYDAHPTAGFTLIAEMGEIPADDQPKFNRLSYSVKEYALLLPISRDLLEDSTVNLLSYIARWCGKKRVLTLNKAILTALKALTPSNIVAATCMADLKKVLNVELDPSISMSSIIFTNQSGFNFLDTLEDKNGRPLLQPDPTTGTPMIFNNKRVVMLSDALLPSRTVTATGATKGTYHPMFIGDGKQFLTLFMRKDLEMESSHVGGNAYATNSVSIRSIMRLDCQTIDDKAMVYKEIFIPAT